MKTMKTERNTVRPPVDFCTCTESGRSCRRGEQPRLVLWIAVENDAKLTLITSTVYESNNLYICMYVYFVYVCITSSERTCTLIYLEAYACIIC